MKKSTKIFVGVFALSAMVACGNRADSDGNDVPDTRYDENSEIDTGNNSQMNDTSDVNFRDSNTTTIPPAPIVP